MKRTGKIKWGNLRVGLFIVFAFAMLLYSSFRGGGTSIFQSKDRLVAYVYSVDGLVKGSPVWLGGVEVGNVKSVKFVNIDERRRIKVEFVVTRSVWEFITMDSKIKLGTIGLLGDKYVEVIPGSKDQLVVEPGAVLGVIEEGGIASVTEKVPSITGSLDSVLTNLKDVSRKLSEGKGTAGKMLSDSTLYDNFVAALDRTTELMTEIRKNQKTIMDKLGSTLTNTEGITARIDSGQGSLGKIINEDEIYDNLARSSMRLDSILTKIDRGDGSAGALLNDDRLYEEIHELVLRINNLVTDIEENPRKYFKFSVF
jgi:phospholipid/cholesterol/gamma-HCH transport system substrate-binding protein